MSRIIKLEAENIKRLKAVRITPKGNVIVIGGQNAQGKSSILDAIAMALGGKNEIPETPVRKGEKKASVILELDDIIVKRTFTDTGGTTLVIENKEGLRFQSPQEVLNKLTAKLTFDPVAFMRLDPKAQLLALKNLVGLDFSSLDAERKKLYDERTSQNAIVTRTKVQAEQLPHFPNAPAEPVSTADLVAELDAATKHNAQLFALESAAANADEKADEENNFVTKTEKDLAAAEAQVAALKERLITAKSKAKAAGEKLAEANAAVTAFAQIDKAPITSKLSDAGTTNSQVNANKQRAAKLAELDVEKKKADDLTAKIEAIDKQKADQLTAAKFPVPGLSFNDSGVLYNEIPLEQASGAEKLRVSVAIAAAGNSKLKVMLVRDGSLLDDANMELLEKLAEEYDIQCFVERVGSDKHVQVIIEDGEVQAPAEDNTAPLPLGGS